MNPSKITRAQLQEAIEDGIAVAPMMTAEQKMMLRHVGATTNRVAHGTFMQDGCGCPLTQAGIVAYDPLATSIPMGCRAFYGAFDRQLRYYSNVVEVEG